MLTSTHCATAGYQKFVARRARKFVSQGNRLTLPGIELAYVLNCLGLSPRFVLFDVHLDQVSTVLAELHAVKDPSSYGKGHEFWDGEFGSFLAWQGDPELTMRSTTCRLLPCSSAEGHHPPLHRAPRTARQAAAGGIPHPRQGGRRAGAHLVQVRALLASCPEHR